MAITAHTRKVLWGITGFYVLGIVLLAVVFGISTHKNNEFKPQNEFKLINWVHLGVFSFCKLRRSVRYPLRGFGRSRNIPRCSPDEEEITSQAIRFPKLLYVLSLAGAERTPDAGWRSRY